MKRTGLLLAAALVTLIPRPSAAQSAYEQLQMLTDALNLVRGNYVDSIPYTHLARAAINGILRSLDPHSYFLPAAAFEQRIALESGKLTTAGLTLTEIEQRIIVLSVERRGVADRAGIQAGDRVIALNDTSTAGARAAELELRMSGAERVRFTVTLERGRQLSPDTFRVTLRTEPYRDRSVFDARPLSDGVGYVRLAQFGANAGDELESAIKKLRSQRATSIIVDLRDNPGGRVIEAVDIAGLFLRKGTVVFRTDGRKADTDTSYITKRDGPFAEMPVALLTDRGTASASEALAAALQDHGRAAIVGRRSFGKALIQAPFLMKTTGDVMWLTIARVYSPNGRLIQRDYRAIAPEAYRSMAMIDTASGGVVPDIAVTPATLPAWWARASAEGLHYAVADSFAATLDNSPATRDAWLTDSEQWTARLFPALLARLPQSARAEDPAPEARAAIATTLAARVAEVRWGADAGLALLLAADPDIRAATTALQRR